MWFSIDRSNQPQTNLEHVIDLGHGWYFRSYLPLVDTVTKWGYDFQSPHSGNAVIVQQQGSRVVLDLSLFKDFDLVHDQRRGIAITNLDVPGADPLPRDTVHCEFHQGQLDTQKMSWKNLLGSRGSKTASEVKQKITQILQRNILSRRRYGNDLLAVFTGGLDSGTICAVLDSMDLDVRYIISESHMMYWPDLEPTCIVAKGSYRQENYSPYSFYHRDLSGALTGFFGDTVCLHNATLYAQSRDLISNDLDAEDLYDVCPDNAQSFYHVLQIDKAIQNIVLSTKFVHWYPDFEIIDPYRDPEILQSVCCLDLENLVKQFGSAWIQRDIVREVAPEWLPRLCKKKNDYSQFTT